MFPKRCVELCIYVLVHYTTTLYDKLDAGKEQYMAIRQIWEDLWKLPRNITHFAGELLHATVTYKFARDISKDISKQLLTLLAANLKRISFIPFSRNLLNLKRPTVLEQCDIFNKEYQLLQLDVTGVDLEANLEFLVRLLPRCTHLTSLKLGCNTTIEVLTAAKQCPLQALHISERLVYAPRISFQMLMVGFFGESIMSISEAFRSLEDGKIPNLNPVWPDLNELLLGFCHINCEFFIILLVFHKKLHSVNSNILCKNQYLLKYLEIKTKYPEMPTLSLRKVLSLSFDKGVSFADVLPCLTPDLENITAFANDLEIQGQLSHIKILADKFPNLKVLHLLHVRHICLSEPPSGVYCVIGKQIKTLEINGCIVDVVDLKDLCIFLRNFPVLEELQLTFKHGLISSSCSPPKEHCFPSVTSLKLKMPQLLEGAPSYILKMFPKLQKIVFMGIKSPTSMLGVTFRNLRRLRVLMLSEPEIFGLSELMALPRATKDGRRWELHLPVGKLISESVVNRLLSSGWTIFPSANFNL